MSSFGGTIHRDELFWLYRLPFDAALVSQSFPFSYDRAVLHEAAARSLGFKTDTRATVGLDWQKLPLSAVGFLLSTPETNPQPAPDSPSTDQSVVEATGPPPHTLLIILKIEGEQRLYFRIGSQAPQTITTSEATARLGTELILVGKESATADDEVILCLALIMFMLFNLTMTWLRQYLVLHTSNCIDAVLDSKTFRHLIPEQLKRVINSLLRKQDQKQQQKTKQRWNRCSFRSTADELECAA